jgi:glyoxylate carboligase
MGQEIDGIVEFEDLAHHDVDALPESALLD